MKKLLILLAALTIVSAGCKKQEVVQPATQVKSQEAIDKENLAKAQALAEKERLAKEQMERERLEKERMLREQLAKERAEAERLEKERMLKEQLAREKAAMEQLAKERAAREKMLATLADIKLEHFVLESAEITPSLAESIKRIIAETNGRKGTLTVIGHTDSTGSGEYNYALSEKRAKSVEEFLRSYGLSNSIDVVVKWEGELSPKYDNSNPSGRSSNRRVDFLFYDAE